MNKLHKKRLIIISSVVLLLSLSLSLILFALKNNIDLYYTPSDLIDKKVSIGSEFRLGGMVELGSLKYEANTQRKYFSITDFKKSTKIYYDGIFPDLFKEKQGVVVKGRLLANGQVEALDVLAKHDENYMPPSIKRSKS